MHEAMMKPYGSWKSPITPSVMVQSAIRLGEIMIDGTSIYWNEIHPEEKGRGAIVFWDQTQIKDILPKEFDAKTRVHEYGGGSFTVCNGIIYFCNFHDQQLYSLFPSGETKKLTHSDTKRYANPVVNLTHNLIYAIEEEHRSEKEVINTLIGIDLSGEKEVMTIHSGYDFYSSPALNPARTKLAFLAWNHPNMPWDGSELLMGDVNPDGSLSSISQIAGGLSESIYQPRFSPDGTLYFISDRNGFWNIYRLGKREIEECCPMESDCGIAAWTFATSQYDFIQDQDKIQIACISTLDGIDFIGLVNLFEKRFYTLDMPYTSYGNLHVCGRKLIFKAGSPMESPAIVSYDVDSQKIEVIKRSKELNIDPGYISIPEMIEFPTDEEQTAFAFYYPPKNSDFIPPPEDKPPLIVKNHGGPSSHVNTALNLEIQFWTSRGFGFLDVNYGGSTGFGREYRNRLKGNLGRVDVNDCINATLFLVEQGRVDKNRLIVRGGSAGGYITLASLTFHDLFHAGASYYGISDLEALISETHKFESHYFDGLIGPYPEDKEKYIKRSPIHFIDQISCPIILFQGTEDKIVLPSQTEKMYQALLKKGLPTAYLLFEGEGHGFRIDKNIIKALEAELYFYSQIFHFKPADELTPIKIDNLK